MIPIQINRPDFQYDSFPKNVPMTNGPIAEAKTINVVAILLIAPKCVYPYNSTHSAVADTDISATETDTKHKYINATYGLLPNTIKKNTPTAIGSR